MRLVSLAYKPMEKYDVQRTEKQAYRTIAVVCGLFGLVTLATLQVAFAANGPAPAPFGFNADYHPSFSLLTTNFPDASLVDLSGLHERPTGSRGELFCGADGHFYFEDATRARFWGINIAKSSVFIPKPLIEAAVAAIDRAGFNLVRFHHLDDVDGLLPPERAGTAQRIDPVKLDLLDYWIAQCGRRGIYVYLDLLDYRTFYEAEGVPKANALGRGAKPYAVFDPRLITLQQEYARQLLVEHINPYTRLSYAQDPTVCLLELCDENGLFIKAKDWPQLVSPYREALEQRWNEWLQERYGDTATLREAWTDADGQQGLLPGERLENRSVQLFPSPTRGFPSPTIGSFEPEAGQTGRVADRRLFFYSLHEKYFRTMRDYLRSLGVRQPLTAVTDTWHLSDLKSVARNLDFVGLNFYYDHPQWRAGNEWQLPAIFQDLNPLADRSLETFVPRVCSGRVTGRPLVVREWNICWPNRYRAIGLIEAAVYGALQDLDGLILFTFDVRPERQRLDYFDLRTDPARWQAAALGAAIFLRRLVSPAKRQAIVAYSHVDTHFPTGQPFPTDIYRLGWICGLSTLFFEERLEKGPQSPGYLPHRVDLVLASGRTNGGAYPGEHAILCGNWPASDLYAHCRDQSVDMRSQYDVATVPEKTQNFTFGGTMFDAGAKERLTAAPGYLLADVRARPHLRPIGIGEDGETCFGFRDMKRQNYVFRRLNAMLQLRVALDALNQLYGENVSHAFIDQDYYLSDTLQVRREPTAGLLLVNTPQAQIIAGDLSRPTLTRTQQMAVQTKSPLGVLAWINLERGPLAQSSRWLLKMITSARNIGEKREIHLQKPQQTLYALQEAGQGPPTDEGKPTDTPTVVTTGEKTLLRLYLLNGHWELLCLGSEYHFYCSTPNVRLELPMLNNLLRVTIHKANGTEKTQQATQPLVYPEGAAYITIRNW